MTEWSNETPNHLIMYISCVIYEIITNDKNNNGTHISLFIVCVYIYSHVIYHYLRHFFYFSPETKYKRSLRKDFSEYFRLFSELIK